MLQERLHLHLCSLRIAFDILNSLACSLQLLTLPVHPGRYRAGVDPEDMLFDRIVQFAGDPVAFGQGRCFAGLLQGLFAYLGSQPFVCAVAPDTLLHFLHAQEEGTKRPAHEPWQAVALVACRVKWALSEARESSFQQVETVLERNGTKKTADGGGCQGDKPC